MHRTPATTELLAERNAFMLLAQIAIRARFRADPSVDGLRFGQARIGDFDSLGMTRKEYRTAQKRLARLGFASFQGTPQGTIATLIDDQVFQICDDYSLKSGQPEGHRFTREELQIGAINSANEGPSKGQQGATNKNGNKERMVGGAPAASVGSKVSVSDLKLRWPGVDVDCELAKALRFKRRHDGSTASVDLAWFEAHWLPRAGPSWRGDNVAELNKRPGMAEPKGDWRTWLEERSPGNVVNAENRPWSQLDVAIQAEAIAALALPVSEGSKL